MPTIVAQKHLHNEQTLWALVTIVKPHVQNLWASNEKIKYFYVDEKCHPISCNFKFLKYFLMCKFKIWKTCNTSTWIFARCFCVLFLGHGVPSCIIHPSFGISSTFATKAFTHFELFTFLLSTCKFIQINIQTFNFNHIQTLQIYVYLISISMECFWKMMHL